MITDFEDFCLYMYCTVDDLWKQVKHLFERPGPQPECSDSELITMVLVGECKGWDVETELLSNWASYRHLNLFSHIPSQSRLNRRRRNLAQAFNLIRRIALTRLDIAQDRQCALDALPVEVIGFHLVPSSGRRGDWLGSGAAFGRVCTKKKTIFGYKLHLLITLGGAILDFELVGANISDQEAGASLLSGHSHLDAVADKGFIDTYQAEQLRLHNDINLITLPRRNQKRHPISQMPVFVQQLVSSLINSARQIVETVNGQLTEQFNIEITHAYTFSGLCARLHSKLAAHTLCIFINRLMGKADFLHLKQLAFPI
jgi:Transposase DDE domain